MDAGCAVWEVEGGEEEPLKGVCVRRQHILH